MTAPLTPADLDRAGLAVWVRELLMAGHLIDRAGMPLLIADHGTDVMRDVAIDEWRGASPVYTRRTQELLGFRGGSDVATIFKGMQLDIGAPPQFLDFRYTVHDAGHGEFRLDHCGALMDVEPMGDEFVVAMCHDIEDPTFPATACATNPRAVVEPVHRPPRTPADRHPHCHWTVTVDETREPVPEPPQAQRVAATRAGSLPVAPIIDRPGAPGATDYQGPLQADLDLESFSAGTLRAVADEVALQGHLLVLSWWMAVADRFGPAAADDLTRRQLVGVGAVTSERLRRAFGLGGGPEALASVLELHPLLRPRSYVAATVGREGAEVVVEIGPCPALEEPDARAWPALLDAAALAGVVWGVDSRAVAEPRPGSGGRAWTVSIGARSAPEPAEATLTRFSTGAAFRFSAR